MTSSSVRSTVTRNSVQSSTTKTTAAKSLLSHSNDSRFALFSITENETKEEEEDQEEASQEERETIPSPTMLCTIREIEDSPPSSLPSLGLPSDDSFSSVESYCSEDLSTLQSYQKQRLSPPQSPTRGVARSQSLPVGLPSKKNSLFVPPHDTHYALKQKKKRRHKRERKTAAGAVGGMVAGGLVLGPVGVVVGAAVGGFATRQIAKKSEKRLQRRREQESFRNFATSKSIQWTLNGDAAVFT